MERLHGGLRRFPLLRTLGVESIGINIVVQDGLCASPISRPMHSLHTLYYMRDEDAGVDEKHYTLKNSDLVFVVKCISHSICNACKWGLADVVSERIVDDAYIVM